MIKILVQFIFIQIIVMVIALVLWIKFPKSDRFHENQLNIVSDLQQRLIETSGQQRIILLGGSSFGFSVSAESITKELGILTLNLGTHAGIRFYNIWNLYKDYLDPELDTVILSPELQLISKLNGKSEEYCQIVYLKGNIDLAIKNLACLPSIIKNTILDVYYYSRKLEHPKHIYFRSAINSYGDNISHLSLQNEKINFNQPWTSPPDNQQIEEYLYFVKQKYIKKGFETIYVTNVFPETGCRANLEYLTIMINLLNDSINKSNKLSQRICYSDNLFFNTIYHMNAKGRIIRTEQVLDQISRLSKFR